MITPVLSGPFLFVLKTKPPPYLNNGSLHLKCRLPIAFTHLSLITANSPPHRSTPGAHKKVYFISSPLPTLLHTMVVLNTSTVHSLTKLAPCALPATPLVTCGTSSVQPPHTSPTSLAPLPTTVRPRMNFG